MRKIDKQKGITLIALVITIIVLLILAGISIQAITNTGLFEGASQAKKEAKRSQIVEWLNLKLIEEQAFNPLGTSEEIIKATRQNVYNNISQLQKMGKPVMVGNTKTEENGEQVDIYFYVQVDEDVYKVDIRGTQFISENVTDIDTTAPSSFTISKSEVGVNSFTLSATFEDDESGLGKIIWYYKRPEDTSWQSEEKIYAELNGSIAGSTTKTYSISDMTIGGEVQAYAVGYDVSGNSITTTNADENNPLIFNTETYTISYNANGGEGAPETQSKYYGINITLSSTEPTRDKYTFLGWAEDSTATSTTYAVGSTYNSNNSTTLYAVYDYSPILVTEMRAFDYDINTASREITIKGLSDYGKSLETIIIPSYCWIDNQCYDITKLTWTYGGTNNSGSPNKTVKNVMFMSNQGSSLIPGHTGTGITEISNDAFADCTNLVSINFGDSITTVPNGSCGGCNNLENVYIGNSTTKIGMYCFKDCYKLKYMIIPESVTDLSEGMVFHCWSSLGTNSNSALEAVYVSSNAKIRNAASGHTYALAPHQGKSHTVKFYSSVAESNINSNAGGNSWWRYNGNVSNSSDSNMIGSYTKINDIDAFKTLYKTYYESSDYQDMMNGWQ